MSKTDGTEALRLALKGVSNPKFQILVSKTEIFIACSSCPAMLDTLVGEENLTWKN